MRQWFRHVGRLNQFTRFGSTFFSRQPFGIASNRPLRFEVLEDRWVLSTVTVNTLIDVNANDGLTTLREAIAATAPDDTIDFSVTGAINLSNLGQLTINKNLTIQGPGAGLLTIRAFDTSAAANNGTRIFNIDDGNASSFRDVSLSGLTLTGGDMFGNGGAVLNAENLAIGGCVISGNAAFSGGGKGGAVYSSLGQLSLILVTVANNSAFSGGGVEIASGSGTMTSAIFSGNSAVGTGGAIRSSGSLAVRQSTLTNNTAGKEGGGINAGGVTEVRESVIVGNSAFSGGGISIFNNDLTISDSTISGNHARNGGGLSIGGLNHTVNVIQTTFSANTAERDGGGIYRFNSTVTLNVSHTTVTNNLAGTSGGGSWRGGGIFNMGGTSGVNLQHAIVAKNLDNSGTAPDLQVLAQEIGTVRYSLIGNNSGTPLSEAQVGSPDANGNMIGGQVNGVINPLLSPLTGNGGPMFTHALMVGSPAVDAGDPSFDPNVFNPPLVDDQRGAPFVRVFDGDGVGGSRIDIGAFELQPLPAAFSGDYDGDNVVSAADYIVWRKTMGTPGVTPYSGADGSGNGSVGPEDYDVWRAHFGQTLPQPASASGAAALAVTEPTVELGEAFAPSPAQTIAALVEATAGTARRTEFAILNARAEGYDSSTRRHERINDFRVPKSAGDNLLLTLAIDCVGRTRRQDMSVFDVRQCDDRFNDDWDFQCLSDDSLDLALAEWR